jgi:hypothetical protein
MWVEVGEGKGCCKSHQRIEYLIFKIIDPRCHGHCLSNVGCKYLWKIFFSTPRNFEKVLLHPMSM